MDVAPVATALREEARQSNERRLLVLAGNRSEGYDAARRALDAAEISRSETVQVASRRTLDCEQVTQHRAGNLLGTTCEAVVFDAHDELSPNALGRVVGAVDGGGLFVLLAPPLDSWPARRDEFDETLAVQPFDVEDVTGNFRRRFVAMLRAHPGVAIVNVDSGATEKDGLTRPASRVKAQVSDISNPDFPRIAYEACLTDDQLTTVCAFENLRQRGQDARDEYDERERAVVVEADRGRGKSSAAGIAAGCFAADGDDVLVTARNYRSAREVFVRASAVLDSLGKLVEADREPPARVSSKSGGTVRFEKPTAAVEADADVVLVDEAAALSVRLQIGRAHV